MEFKYPDDSLMLHTDAYQINMVQTYWSQGIQDRQAVFEVFSGNYHLRMATQFCGTGTNYQFP